MQDINDEIRAALSEGPEGLDFEEIAGVETSPLNQPVKEKEFAEPPQVEADGVPEQKIGGNAEGLEVPKEQAEMMADALFGVANNIIGIGGGFFVQIKKHPDFFEYEELIQVIDEQNEKNVKRLKLDEDDKAMLRPILVAILQKQAKVLTPEQQLIMAGFSILMKKVQVAMTIRSENSMLTERIRGIISEEKEQATENEARRESVDAPAREETSEISPIQDEIEEIVAEEVEQTFPNPRAPRPPFSPQYSPTSPQTIPESKAQKPAT